MTDKELKQLLKNAYILSESDKSQRFIKEHEKRSRQLADVIKNEFHYMGIKSILAGLVICGLFMAVAVKGDENMMWIMSSMLPICSLIPLIHILRSGRYGMCELEAASRFSLTGIVQSDEAMNLKFKSKEQFHYIVDEAFPKITESTKPYPEICDAEYDLSLNALDEYLER